MSKELNVVITKDAGFGNVVSMPNNNAFGDNLMLIGGIGLVIAIVWAVSHLLKGKKWHHSAVWYVNKYLLIVVAVIVLYVQLCNLGFYMKTKHNDPTIDAATGKIADTANWIAGRKPQTKSTISFELDPNIPDDMFEAMQAKSPLKVDNNNVCVVAGRWMAQKYNVPEYVVIRTLYTESAGNPKAINKNTNGSADYGCMQINDKAHPNFFKQHDWSDAVQNMAYAVLFLKKLYSDCGKWSCAVLNYNSKNEDRHAQYGKALNKTAMMIGAPTVGR